MKLFELLNILNPDEKKRVKKYLQPCSEQFQKLLTEILNRDEESFKNSKHIIYRKIYGKPWSDSQSKYFNNQLSELFDIIRDYLSQYWIEQKEDILELNKIANYLCILRDRLDNDLFEKEFNYYHNLFKQKFYNEGLSELYMIRYNFLIRNPKCAAEAQVCLNESFRYKILAHREAIANLKYTAYTLNYAKEIYGLGKLIRKKILSNRSKIL